MKDTTGKNLGRQYNLVAPCLRESGRQSYFITSYLSTILKVKISKYFFVLGVLWKKKDVPKKRLNDSQSENK